MSDQNDPVDVGIKAPEGFKIHEVPGSKGPSRAMAIDPPLGPLAQFAGEWAGLGFNTIFRPSQPSAPPLNSDNVLELNVTTESLAFSKALGSIPNRGEVQPDLFLNGVPYLQTVNDVTNPDTTVGIHFEPGIWLNVPETTNPAVPIPSVVRMASIPHGATILAQGTSATAAGPPTIPALDITPFVPGGGPIKFPSQTASNQATPRIPQVLPVPGTSLTLADWQAMLDDPNSVLRNAIQGQAITETVALTIATAPAAPLVGGGTQDMAFLVGNPLPNANAVTMTATFWIETVQYSLEVPCMPANSSIDLDPASTVPGLPLPGFRVRTASAIYQPITISVTYPQIQYSQTVQLVFAGLSWPHASVATLVPAAPIAVDLP